MTLTRGDTGFYKFQRLDVNGDPITSIPVSLYFTVKKSFSTNVFIIQKTLSDMTLGEDNYWHIVIEPEDTINLKYGSYVFDIEVTTDNYVLTICKGQFEITEESTWSENK